MSLRFEHFIERIGRKSDFLPLKNRLLDAMVEDAKNKYKNYPRLVNKMKRKWEKGTYKKEKAISYLLKDNVEEFLGFYMNTLFPFRKTSLSFENISTPSRLDFIITIIYEYSKNEIKKIDKILNGKQFPKDPTIEKICKFILLYTMNSFAQPIEEVFDGPFAFIPQNINSKELEEGRIKISVSVQGREQ